MLAECPKCGDLMRIVSHCDSCGWSRRSDPDVPHCPRCPKCGNALEGNYCVHCEIEVPQAPGDA